MFPAFLIGLTILLNVAVLIRKKANKTLFYIYLVAPVYLYLTLKVKVLHDGSQQNILIESKNWPS